MYVLDTNVFIDAANAYSAFDLTPGYWDFIVGLFDSQCAVSVRPVYDELVCVDDEDPLKAWAKRNSKHFVVPDARVVASYQQVMTWAQRQSYKPSAIKKFQSVADSWIVAYALANNWVVVTHEKSAPEAKRHIKIPDVCAGVGVTYASPFEMLRSERMRLVLSPLTQDDDYLRGSSLSPN